MSWVATGTAAVSALGSLFGSKSKKKAEQKAAKERLEVMKLQRGWDVEDRDMARKFDLEDRAARQALLNPYAKHFKGERLAAEAAPVATQTVAPITPGGRAFQDEDLMDQRYRIIR